MKRIKGKGLKKAMNLESLSSNELKNVFGGSWVIVTSTNGSKKLQWVAD